jgi:hypothetical protein
MANGAVLLKVSPSPVRISRLRNLGESLIPGGEAGYDENARKERLGGGVAVSKILVSFHVLFMGCFPTTIIMILEIVT